MSELSRKDLKRPDQFQVSASKWLEWAVNNQQTLLIAAGGLLVVLLGIAGFSSYREASARQANEDLAQALAGFDNEQYTEAAVALGQVSERWSSTGVGTLARVFAVQAELNAGEIDSAKKTVGDLLAKGSLAPYLRQQLLVSLAFALEESGDTNAAAEKYKEAISAGGPYTGDALLAEARLRANQGDTDGAVALYRRYLDDFPESSEVTSVEARLADLGAPE